MEKFLTLKVCPILTFDNLTQINYSETSNIIVNEACSMSLFLIIYIKNIIVVKIFEMLKLWMSLKLLFEIRNNLKLER